MFTNTYNPQRQLLFVKRQLSLFQQPWLYAAGVVFLGLLTATVIKALFEPTELRDFQSLYVAVFFFGGFLFTSQIFKEMHAPHRSYFFLTLPASSLEKLTGAWLLTSPLYVFAYTAVAFIIYFIGFLLAGESFSLSFFFNKGLAVSIVFYMVVQTTFLWGAVYFRKNNFLKTVLSIIVISLLLSIFGAALRYLLLDNQMLVFVKEEDFAGPNAFPSGLVKPIYQFTLWALGPYMLLMAYFTLKEREV